MAEVEEWDDVIRDLDEYQRRCRETAVYPSKDKLTAEAVNYCLMGLGGEVGEMQNKFKKILRGDKPYSVGERDKLAQELGGVMWYVASLAYELGFDLHEIATANVRELASRKQRGTIQGDGDDR